VAGSLCELVLGFLRGERPSEEEYDRIWKHVGDVLGILAALQAEKPKQVAVQWVEYAPNNEEWEQIFSRWLRAARELENGGS
jgi:hypothetical protein